MHICAQRNSSCRSDQWKNKLRATKLLVALIFFALPASAVLGETPIVSAGGTKEVKEITEASLKKKPSPETIRSYRTPEERREAGFKRELTDWLTVISLLEVDAEHEWLHRSNSKGTSHEEDYPSTVQLTLEAEPLEWLSGELSYEYEIDTGKQVIEEAIGAVEYQGFGLEVGKMEVPFGEYFSYFVTGPILEFGETSDHAALVSYGYEELFEVAVFIYDGKAERAGSGTDTDWGIAVETQPTEWLMFGASYISDLADSDERFLEDEDDQYQRRVWGLSGYAAITTGPYDLTFEYVGATQSFQEIDPEFNTPRAWNIELTRALSERVALATRFEWSDNIEDAPEWRSGISVSWRISERFLLSVDYLRGWFKRETATDEADRNVNISDMLVGQLSIGL